MNDFKERLKKTILESLDNIAQESVSNSKFKSENRLTIQKDPLISK